MDRKLEARVRRLERLLNVYEDRNLYHSSLNNIRVGMHVIDLANNRHGIVIDYGDMDFMFDKHMHEVVLDRRYSDYLDDAKFGTHSKAAIIQYTDTSRGTLKYIVDPEDNLIEDDE